MIVHPASPSAEMTETVSRLHGEMLAVGLAVTIVARTEGSGPDSTSAPAWMTSLATTRGIDAAIDVIGDAQVDGADIWVFQLAPRPPEITHVPAERAAENVPARLAIRAIDVLRSRLIERELAEASRAATTAQLPTPGAAPLVAAGGESVPDRARLGVALGAALLSSFAGVGPAIAPVARVELALGRLLGIEGEVEAFGTRPTVGTPGSSASVGQQFALLGACLCVPSTARLRPLVGLSAGALRITADGEAQAPLQGHSVAKWSFLVDASAGMRLRLAQRAYLAIAAHVQVAEPYVDIKVVNSASATIGRPNLMLTLALGEWL